MSVIEKETSLNSRIFKEVKLGTLSFFGQYILFHFMTFKYVNFLHI